MPSAPSPTIDYRALIQDRKAKQTRPVIRHVLCLSPDLFSDLEEVRAEQAADRWASPPVDPSSPPADVRLGDQPAAPEPSLGERAADLEAQIAPASVVAVFKAPSAERQAELNKMFGDTDDVIGHTIGLILDAFSTFEVNREPIPADALGRSDLADLLPVLAQGELLALGNRIVEASSGAPDLPLSVQRSLLRRR